MRDTALETSAMAPKVMALWSAAGSAVELSGMPSENASWKDVGGVGNGAKGGGARGKWWLVVASGGGWWWSGGDWWVE